MKKIVIFLTALLFSVSADSDDNPNRLLGQAAQDLMRIPIKPVEKLQQLSGYEIKHPEHDDLAISRLQSKTSEFINDLWILIRDPQRLSTLASNSLNGVPKGILQTYANQIQGDIFALDKMIENSGMAKAIQTDINELGSWKSSWENLQKIIGKVNLFYSFFNEYMSDAYSVSDTALDDFARSILEPGSLQEISLQTALVNLHNISVPGLGLTNANGQLLGQSQRDDIFYRLYLILTKNGGNFSNLGQSPHQLLYNLYNLIALTEIKGYAMIQFSYMMLKLYNRGNFSLESDLARRNFEAQATEKLLNIKGILPNLSRNFWQNDPVRHVEGKTYIRVTQLLQGILENEADMSTKNSCKDKCSSYTVAQTDGRCFKNLLCAKQRRCENGRLFDCQFFDADSWVCMSQDQERRYDWIEYEDSTLLGNKGQCINKLKVDSWWRWIFWHCSYCLCKCDAPGPHSDRYWSLRSSVADPGKVVTGVRFVKRNRVIQIEIEQAEALPEGGVREETRDWKLNTKIDIESDEDGTDFMTMSYEQRALDTDLLEAPAGHVITGVRLRNIGGHINLEVQVTPITFTDGNLIPERTTWLGNDNTPATREVRRKVHILFPDISTKYRGQSEIDSLQNQFIQFDATSTHKDVMQTTVPFIDSQPVRTSTGSWLSGIGMYHKGHIGYGGYVGLMIKTFDFSRHLLPDMKSSKSMKEELKYDFEKLKVKKPDL